MSSSTSSQNSGSIYLLKTRAITGALVPARGEHVEYTELHVAIRDGQLLRDVFGEEVYVVDGRTGNVAVFI